MPASRWIQSVSELLKWFEEEGDYPADLFLRPITPRVMVKNGEHEREGSQEEEEIAGQIPAELPILPLRGVVVYPQTAVPLTIGQPPSFRLGEFSQNNPYLKANIELIPEVLADDLEVEALARNARDQFEKIAEMIPSIPRELVASVVGLEDALQTVYTIANFQRMELSDAQALLELDSVSGKLRKLVAILAPEVAWVG